MTRLLSLALRLVQASEGSGVHTIFRSTDRGRSWVRADMGNARVNAFGAVGKTVFAGADAGIYVSDDDGGSGRQMGGVARRMVGLATVEKAYLRRRIGKGFSFPLTNERVGRVWACL